MILAAAYLFLFILFIALVIVFSGEIFRKLARHYFSLQMFLVTFPPIDLREDRRSSVTGRASFRQLAERGDRREISDFAEQKLEFFKRLGEFKIPFVLEAAVHSVGEEIHFYLFVSRKSAPRVRSLFHSIWPAGKLTPVDDYDLWLDGSPETGSGMPEGGLISASYIKQVKSFLLPLKAPKNGDFSPFLAILREFSRIKTLGEGIAIQFVVRPVQGAIARDAGKLLNKLTKGKFISSPFISPKFILSCDTIPILEEKISQPLFNVTGRIIMSAPNEKTREELFKNIARHLASASAGNCYNELRLVRARSNQKTLAAFLRRQAEEGQQMILNARELTALFPF